MIINLTDLEAGALEIYLQLTEGYRDKQLNSWRLVAEERDENGAPIHRNADDHIELWVQIIKTMKSITKKLREANQQEV